MSTHYGSLIGYLQIRRGTFTLTVCESSQALFNNSVCKCCLHSFYYIFSIHFHCNYQHPLPWSESELTIPGTKVPGNIRSQGQKFPGTFVPGSESSHWELSLAKIPGSEKSRYLCHDHVKINSGVYLLKS